LVLLGASWLGFRNYRSGRGDVNGAARLAGFGFLAQSLGGIVAIHHAPTPGEATRVMNALAFGLFMAAATAVLYLAIEPFVRRRWPQSLISWSRFLDGDIRDPLVSGHILLGAAFGVAVALLQNGLWWYEWQGMAMPPAATQISMLDWALLTQLILSGWIQSAATMSGVF